MTHITALLIVFMIVTPLLTRRYEAEIPSTGSGDARPDAIVVSLTDRHEIYLNKERIGAADLPVRQRALLQGRGWDVFFAAADAVPYNEVMHVMDAVRSGGASGVGIIMDGLIPGNQ